jgi:hypothetical protein
MGEYDSGPRPLAWPLLYPLVGSRTVEDDVDCTPSSFVWPDDPNERTLVPFSLSLNEYNVLASAIDVGSDIAFAEDALRVWWLWTRNMRCEVPICDLVDQCITENPATIAAIVARLTINSTYNEYLSQLIVNVSPPAAGNVYPPRPTSATPDPLCNAATYVVGKLRELFVAIYEDLETLTPTEILEALLGVFGWRSGPLYSLIGLLETNDQSSLLAAFDTAAPGLICQLIADELDQTAVQAWIAETYPSPSVLGDAFSVGLESAADDGKYAQWIAVGATMTGASCDGCDDPPPDPACMDATLEKGLWDIYLSIGEWILGQGFVAALLSGLWYLYIIRAAEVGVVEKIIFKFNVPQTTMTLTQANGTDARTWTGNSVNVEFSSSTIVGWTNMSGANGFRSIMSDIPSGSAIVEICMYYAD